MRLYVAGPMSGYPEHNFPAFRAATDALRKMGHTVTSPVEMDEGEGFNPGGADVVAGSAQWADFLARDVKVVADPTIDGLVVLDGWEQSRGAALEVHVARELGKSVHRLQGGMLVEVKAPSVYQPPSDETILDEAERLVGGSRGDDYGHPGEDFARTAACWSALFGWTVQPEQVALAMICVKLSRLSQTPTKRDSLTDIAGYARTYEAVLAHGGAKGFQDLR
jgi:hypothetical protein